jgi:hypothetical protein
VRLVVADDPSVPAALSEDNLLTAARRLVRFVRIDDAGGGFLSNQTIMAADMLWRHVEAETKRLKQEAGS